MPAVYFLTAFCPTAALIKHISQGMHTHAHPACWDWEVDGMGELFKLCFYFDKSKAERLNQAQTPKDYLLCCFHVITRSTVT